MTNDEIIASLNPTAASVARAFLAQHPDAVLTSGRRTVGAQAEAMAENVAVKTNWIRNTYLSSPLSVAMQAHVKALVPEDRTPENLANGFAAIMNLALPDELRRLSWHLDGSAWDARPVPGPEQEATARRLIATAIASGATGKVLTEEGGIRKLHVQVA